MTVSIYKEELKYSNNKISIIKLKNLQA